MKKLLFGFFFLSVLSMMSCGDDGSDCTSQQFTSEVNAAIDVVNAAAATWASDPSSDNCQAFKDAANDYVDVVEGFDTCAGISQSEYDQAVQAARAAVDSLPCS